ncbi:urease accessory protein UreF [Sanguibacter gelidistatuariae]|uniref:urease accessory protein UreF n=1 Tax=Sanguibacter gelidistatuariae TaxID=1814289 RepID=UPI001FE18D88|nr:urease accessory UreF family protein [Sanguibacter gelidistatuariae]
MTAPTDVRQLLVSLQLADSAFPSGFYTMSHGLEGFSQARWVTRPDVEGLLADLLRHSVGPGDATALARAHDAATAGDWPSVQEIDRRLFASKLNTEMRKASVRSGHQVCDLALEVLGGEGLAEYVRLVKARSTPGCQAVASAVAFAAAGVSVERAVTSDLFAFSASFVGAALRLRLTDHRHAQVVLNAVSSVIEDTAASAVVREIDDMGGCVPVADIMSARHERAEARLFAS